MSIDTATSRISQIEAMIAAASAGSPAPSTAAPATSFNTQLSGAMAPESGTAQTGSPSGTVSGGQYDQLINQSAAKYGIDPALLKGLIQQESGFDPNSTSGAGAVGLTQLMPGTAAALGVSNPRDPAQSIDGGAHFLKQMLDTFGGDVSKALAAYNAGPGAVQRYGGVPPYSETQDYVQKVEAYAQQYRQQGGGQAAPLGAFQPGNGGA